LIAGKSEITSPAELLFLSKFKSGATVDEFRDLMIGPEFYAPHQRRRFASFWQMAFCKRQTWKRASSLASCNQLKHWPKKRSSVSGTKKVLAQRLIGAMQTA